jgi:hypothetical protein
LHDGRVVQPLRFLIASLFLTSLFAGCAGSTPEGSAEVSVVPQNHSGKDYTLNASVFDATNHVKFEKAYTLSKDAHVGTATKLALAAGTYHAQLRAKAADAAVEKTETLDFTIAGASKQLSLIIESDGALDVRVG